MITPGSANALLLSPSGYQIPYSLRFRAANSAYLSRTPASAGNRKTATISIWFKRGGLSATMDAVGVNAANTEAVRFTSGNAILVRFGNLDSTSNALFRDPSGWGHLVIARDTTQATSTDRLKAWWNGTLLTWASYSVPAQNADTDLFNNVAHYIGASSGPGNIFDGYMAEVNFIDGQALTPSSFGQTDATTGVWVPKKYSGTYGTNGFYLKFADATTTTTIGNDSSGNANNFTTSGISVTSGVTFDQMLDTPTLNYCTGNPLSRYTTNTYNFTSGNLDVEMFDSSNVQIQTRMSMGVNSGKWYWEATLISYSIYQPSLGVAADNILNGNYVGGTALQWGVYGPNGDKYNNGVYTAYGSAATTNDVVQIALDMDNGKIWWGKNGTWFASGDPASGTNAAFTNLAGNTVLPAMGVGGTTNAGGKYAFNFGQRAFAYTPPTGFKALNTANLPTPSIKKGSLYMDATLRTGTGATASVSSLSFAPDLVWIKSRSAATDHGLYDAVRGVQKQLESNTTTAETTETTGLTAFNSNGYTVGALAQLNTSAATYVDWAWKEGVTPGFDIVSYVGNNTSNRNIDHSLGVAPSMAVIRNRDANVSGAGSWFVWHTKLTGATYYLRLENTNAQQNSTTPFGTGNWSSTQFMVTNNATYNLNDNGSNYIAYLWSEIEGFSKFGSYTGNGSTDGPFVWCGFRPRWVMIKRSDTTGNWVMLNTAMNQFNVADLELNANLSSSENANAANDLDFLSSGFKIRNTNAAYNDSGGTYVFAAFAENPFKYARAR